MLIELPWPPSILSPNCKKHWATKAKSAKSYRAACACETRIAGLADWKAFTAILGSTSPLPMQITFHPPDKRLRDDDNVISSFKSGRDGLADALSVNDRLFRPTYKICDPVKLGKVVITIAP